MARRAKHTVYVSVGGVEAVDLMLSLLRRGKETKRTIAYRELYDPWIFIVTRTKMCDFIV